jgi:hypothetical protein
MYNTNFVSEKIRPKNIAKNMWAGAQMEKQKCWIRQKKKKRKKQKRRAGESGPTLHISVMGQLPCWAQARLSFVAGKAQG